MGEGVEKDITGGDEMSEKMVIEGEMRWSEGDAVHFGGFEVRAGEGDEWNEVGELVAERFYLPEGHHGWRDWFAPETLGRLRITVERVEPEDQ